MKSVCFLVVGALVSIVLLNGVLYADDQCTKEAVVQAVDQAVSILEAQGAGGLDQVGAIRFCDNNYVFVNDLKGKTLMHIKSSLIGRVLIALKDDTGKRFFADFSEVAKSSQTTKEDTTYYNGSGWVDYRWPKPGGESFYPKTSYIKGCLMGNQSVYVGAGIYVK